MDENKIPLGEEPEDEEDLSAFERDAQRKKETLERVTKIQKRVTIVATILVLVILAVVSFRAFSQALPVHAVVGRAFDTCQNYQTEWDVFGAFASLQV